MNKETFRSDFLVLLMRDLHLILSTFFDSDFVRACVDLFDLLVFASAKLFDSL